jgi:hypothetical protein
MIFEADIDPGVREVLEAAAALDTTEFKVFDLAYQGWFGRVADHRALERYFADYMFEDIVPPWVHYFTRQVLARDRAGELNRREYGLEERPVSRRTLLRGRLYTVALALALLLLVALTLGEEGLPVIARGCYFPPCY